MFITKLQGLLRWINNKSKILIIIVLALFLLFYLYSLIFVKYIDMYWW